MKQPPGRDRFVKYNLYWSNVTDPVFLEMEMVKHGGRWKKQDGEFAGEGMEFHFKRGMSLLWPHIVWHPWAETQLKAYLNNRIIGQIGAASTGKSFVPAACVLFDYYCYPHCTTVLVSSTTRESLEMRVWGEIKSLHRKAKEHNQWLAGYLIEGKQRIVSDSRDEAKEGRDFRNGLVAVACFCDDALIDTPTGQRKIKDVSVGDVVLNASGAGTVTSTMSRVCGQVVRVGLADGRSVDCTPEHPFFTQRGWVKASCLETSDMVFSASETVSILRGAAWSRVSQSEVLLSRVSRSPSAKAMCPMWGRLQAVEPEAVVVRENKGPLLRQGLREPVDCPEQGDTIQVKSTVRALREANAECSLREEVLFCEVPNEAGGFDVCGVRAGVCINRAEAEQSRDAILRNILQEEIQWEGHVKEVHVPNHGRAVALESVSGVHAWAPVDGKGGQRNPTLSLVRDGFGIYEPEAGRGGGWWNPQASHWQRHTERLRAIGTRVDSVAVLEPSGDPRYNVGEGGYRVYNIEVAGHPSYSVNGIVVHNCKKGQVLQGIEEFVGIKNKRIRVLCDELQFLPRSFVGSISNLNKNKDFKCVGSGNPKETTDALGVLCEPAAHLGGWDGGIDQTPTSKTWEIRFPHGICIQFCGTDSPNLNGKMGIPLITQEQIDSDIAFYGKDSIQYSMMDMGMMPRGQGNRRVITRNFCLKFGAMEEPYWMNSQQTRVGFLDASYRGVGGDRCVFGELRFGKNSEGKEIMALIDTMVIPIKDGAGNDLPEDQIATQVREQCENRMIDPSHVFFDSTGRGSLMSAFGRLWSPSVVPIEFGGSPTERPVSTGIDSTCRDHYSKFVTELWYSVRLVVECGQFRGMTEEVMMEGCMREWTFVAGQKIEVETKEKMKLKSGRSPDLFDALAAGVEGARRLGFVIEKITDRRPNRTENLWKREVKDRARSIWRDHDLSYA